MPGVNYSTLLERSFDFAPYFTIGQIAYPDGTEQALLLALVGTLWEATDPVSYVRHLSEEPFPNTPRGSVLLAPSKGDPEVAVVTTEVVARTGAGIALMADWSRAVDLVDESPYPRTGSGVVLYDFGPPWPEPGAHPPEQYPEFGNPHSLPKQSAHHNVQLATFLRSGEIVDVCGGDGCAPD